MSQKICQFGRRTGGSDFHRYDRTDESSRQFRPEYGNKFATYAIRCVDNELLMHLRSKKKQRKEVSMFEPIGTDKEGNQIQLVDVLEFHDKNVADEVTKGSR